MSRLRRWVREKLGIKYWHEEVAIAYASQFERR